MKIIGTGTGTSEARTTHKIQEMEKKSFQLKKMLHVKQILAQNSQKIWDTMQRQNLRIIEIME